MKKIFSMMLACGMASVMALSNASVVSYAANYNTPMANGVVKADTYNNGTIINTTWKTIATSSSGFNCNVYVKCMNTTFVPNTLTVSPTDIRMLDRNGNVVWEEWGAVAGLGNRTFWCGKNVCKIQARCKVGNGTIYVRRAN